MSENNINQQTMLKIKDGFIQEKIPMQIGGEDVEVAYRSWGEQSNPNKLYCLHGVTRNCRDFDYLGASLSDDYHVLCLDTIGRGQSSYFVDITNYIMPNVIAAVMNVIRATSSDTINLLGTSMGGLVAMGIAAGGSIPVAKLILNDVGPFVPVDLNRAISKHENLKPKHFANWDLAFAYHKKNYQSFGPMNDLQWEMFTRNGMRELDDGSFVYDYDPNIQKPIDSFSESDFDVWHIYDQIKCPALVIRGQTSRALLPEVAQEMKQRGPMADLIEIPVTGHAPHLMNDEQVSIIRVFL
ncbi:MAG: alpha/beta hydrolase [Gammaproteobacteria bacterium]|nr:MAG: alpha/beta hydrolase [Gammaproteobacteria bacterium]